MITLIGISLSFSLFGCSKRVDYADSEGVYNLINSCYDKSRTNQEWDVASSHNMARGLGFTNDFGEEMVYLSYDDGEAKLTTSNRVSHVSLKQIRDYLRN